MKIKCFECKKQYDYNLESCPHCGYDNKKRRIINIIIYSISIILFIISLLKCLDLFYTNKTINELTKVLQQFDFKQETKTLETVVDYMKMHEFIEKYGSEAYGEVAYNLNNIRICSMSFCILIIWLGIYLQNKNIKFCRWINFFTIVVFIIFQLLPLGFGICVRNSISDESTYTRNNEIVTENGDILYPIKEKY